MEPKLKLVYHFLISVILLTWIVASGYLCIGGLSMIQGIEKVRLVEDKYEEEIIRQITRENTKPTKVIRSIDSTRLIAHKTAMDFKSREAVEELAHIYWYYGFPGVSFIRFLTIMPYTVLLFLSSGAAGVAGGTTSIVAEIALKKIALENTQYISRPVFGFFIGIMTLAISYVVPSFLTIGDASLNMMSVVLLCFFFGIFSSKLFDWVVTNLDDILKRKTIG